MAVKITIKMLDCFRAGHSFEAVSRLRELLSLAGGVDIELHPLEVLEARRLRVEARRLDRRATEIETRGPYPEDCDPDAAPS